MLDSGGGSSIYEQMGSPSRPDGNGAELAARWRCKQRSAVLDAMAGVVGMAGNPNMIGTLFGLAQIKLEGRHVNDVRWCAV